MVAELARIWIIASVSIGLVVFPSDRGWILNAAENGPPATKRETSKSDSAAKPVPSIAGAKETDARLHSDGKGWRLQQARVTDPTRPRILLVGDSILNGYLDEVTKTLEGKAYLDAWVTPTSQADKQLPRIIEEILARGPYQVIHVNLGLHGWQPGRIPPDQFEPLTRLMMQSFRKHAPQATLIWASTTPVTKQNVPGELDDEVNPTIVEHNRLAAKVMASEQIQVNDLYALMLPKLDMARGDRFHWKPEGRSLQAQAVASALQKGLDEYAGKQAAAKASQSPR